MMCSVIFKLITENVMLFLYLDFNLCWGCMFYTAKNIALRVVPGEVYFASELLGNLLKNVSCFMGGG